MVMDDAQEKLAEDAYIESTHPEEQSYIMYTMLLRYHQLIWFDWQPIIAYDIQPHKN
jgi:hypothetical protein